MTDLIAGIERTAESGRVGRVEALPTELAPLVNKGVLFTVLTLGIYRFWYRTNLRRWYRTNTVVDGDALAFHGTAKELLIGFLIAIAIFVPLYGLFIAAGTFAGEGLAPFVSAAYGVVFLALAQFGLYRARRYRLTRTSWRGLRFDQDGSAWHYARVSLGYMVLVVLSLGILFPLLRLKTEAFRIRHTRFGSATGSFDAPLVPLLKRWAVTLTGIILIFVVPALFAVVVVGDPLRARSLLNGPRALVLIVVCLALMTSLFVLLWSRYIAFEFRHFTNHTMIGEVRFRSEFPVGTYAKRVILFMLSVTAVLIGAALFFVLFTIGGIGSALAATIPFVLILIYLGIFVLFSVLKELMLNRRFWELGCQTMTLENIQSVDEIIATALSSENATGEGLADALDFGGV
jgi:uncharacterized membrane protein YjgN (DUF898 family)